MELLVNKHPEIKAVENGDHYRDSLNITDIGLQTLLTAECLTKVSLYRANLITGESLKLHVNSAQHIQHLSLNFCSLTDKGLLRIMAMCGTQLTSLDVTGSKITGEGFHALQNKFTNMEKLSLEWCFKISDQGFSEIINISGPLLNTVQLSSVNISAEVKTRIKLNRPNLTIIG